MTSNSTPIKRCSKCGRELPATTEYFYPDKKHGLEYYCKSCQSQRHKDEAALSSPNPIALFELRRLRRVNNELAKEDKRECSTCHRVLPLDMFAKVHGERRKFKCRECTRGGDTPYEYKPHLRPVDGKKLCQSCNKWKPISRFAKTKYGTPYSYCKPCMSKKACRHVKENPHVAKVNNNRRQARKKHLPDNFSHEDWAFALDYFHGRCAVCGRQLVDLFGEHTAAMDHWIPLSSSDCPGTVAENIVPLCHGIDGCNQSKSNKDPYEWLIEKLGKRKANQINARIQEYFDYIKSLAQEAT